VARHPPQIQSRRAPCLQAAPGRQSRPLGIESGGPDPRPAPPPSPVAPIIRHCVGPPPQEAGGPDRPASFPQATHGIGLAGCEEKGVPPRAGRS